MNLWRSAGVGALIAALLAVGLQSSQSKTATQATLRDSHSSREVAIVGDSLTWQAKVSIETAVSSSGYVGQVSAEPGHALSSSWAQSEIARDLRESGVGVIVVETASNDAVKAATADVPLARYAALLHRLLAQAKARANVSLWWTRR